MNEPLTYVKKPVEIQAMRFYRDASHTHAVYSWVEENTLGSFEPLAVLEGDVEPPESGVSIDPGTGELLISTLEGVMRAGYGDWVIRGLQGEFYPCKHEIFVASYDLV